MIKFLFLGRRAPGLTRHAAQAHLRDVHGRMVVLAPADAGAMPSYYVQNHIIDGSYPATHGPHAVERDLITELQFESMGAMRVAVATPYYLQNLRPDEPRFVHDPSVVRLNVAPVAVLEGPRTTAKLFLFVSRLRQIVDERWQAVCSDIAQRMTELQGIVALTRNTVLPPQDDEPFVDIVFEAWFTDSPAAMAAGAEASRLFDVDAVDRDRCAMILAEEFTEERLRILLR